jgi:hypothetical protein
MHHQHVSIGAIEPGEDQQLVAREDPVETVDDVRLEVEPSLGCPLVALLGRGPRVRQRRFDPADCPNVEGQRYGRVSQSMSGCEYLSRAPVKTPPRKRIASTGPGMPRA